MYKNLTITCILGGLTILLGAFGAHSLQEVLTVDGLKSFETAIRYQMFHVLFLLIVNASLELSKAQKNWITGIVFLGIICFSGSIFAIQLGNIPAKSIWFITPFGGLLLLLGWAVTAVFLIQKKKKKNVQ
ncbi:DUF423 domain-containing protein [Tenacibaculum sp. SG-28]|uniref:DUF423 domain-containing protein n=1 Tax=Tenacibaculum sp. SG-28 TaxID=754426 RepID=UPI000CF4A946|nr:DUF423 domain-containing protein [Tenacibaculum sp. SG-28]PQJ22836.1 hypothetical protein BSU00_00570 [Tenacibaculum sp. SG-28]